MAINGIDCLTNEETMSDETLLKLSDVLERTSLSRSTLFRLEGKGQFPKRRQVTDHRVAWPKSEVDEWIDARLDGADLPAVPGAVHGEARL